MLYTIFVSPYQNDVLWKDLLAQLQSNDVLVLFEDAVYGVLSSNAWQTDLKKQKIAVYVLLPDLKARGLNIDLIDGIKVIDYLDFVSISERHHPQVKWQ